MIKNIRAKKAGIPPILTPENLPGFDRLMNEYKGLTYSQLAEQELKHLKMWFNSKFRIDKNKSEQYLCNLLSKDKDNPSIRYPMHRFNCRMMVLNCFTDSDLRFYVDDTAGRLHTPLTNLKSELRAMISYDDKELISADIKNSQPLLSLIFLNPELFEKNEMLKRISLYNEKFYEDFGHFSSSSTMLVNFIGQHSNALDVLLYRDLVLSGEIYEYFGSILKENGLTIQEGKTLRRFAKEEMFKAFFSHNKAITLKENQGLAIFRQTFPHVYEIFKIIKCGKHNTLACVLQNIESEIVLHKVCKEISQTNSEIPLFTIHDSIATTKEYIDLVVCTLSAQINKVIDAMPKIKKEPWDSTLLDNKSEQALYAQKDQSSQRETVCRYGYAHDEILYSMRDVASQFAIGRNKLLAKLREWGILLPNNQPCPKLINEGYFYCNTLQLMGKSIHSPKVTDRGLSFLEELIRQTPEIFN